MNTLHRKKREQARQRCLALSVAILLALLWGTLPAQAADGGRKETGENTAARENVQVNYKDVPAGAWYASFIAELSEENILSGFPDQTFRPAAKVTCGQFLSMAMQAGELMDAQHLQTGAASAVRAAAAAEKSAQAAADRDSQKHWAADFYNMAVQNDILIRNELPFAALDRAISREWMAVICSRILMQAEASGGEGQVQSSYSPTASGHGQMLSYTSAMAAIRDVEEVSAHSFEIVRAYQMRLLSGYPDGTFRPEEGLSRAEAAAVISKLRRLKNQGAGSGQEATQQPSVAQNPQPSGRYAVADSAAEEKELPQGTDKEIPARLSDECWEKDPRDFPEGTVAFYYWLSKEDGAAADSVQGRELKTCMEQQLSDKEAADELFQAFADFADKARRERAKGNQGLRKQYIGQKPVLMDSVMGIVSVYVRPQGTETQYWEVEKGQVFEEFF